MNGDRSTVMLSTAEVAAACGVMTSQVAAEHRLIRWATAGLVQPVVHSKDGRPALRGVGDRAGFSLRWPLDEARLVVILWLAAEVTNSTLVLQELAAALRAVDPDEWHGVWRVTKHGAHRVHQLEMLGEGWLVDLDVADRRLAPFVEPLAVPA